mmetsp:Transcript_30339/g.61081  ORF Transcript_30339/g.61081 Transcript_30339/m.61081 type:complete len:341 (-) Transcript_30339:143-1165(-)
MVRAVALSLQQWNTVYTPTCPSPGIEGSSSSSSLLPSSLLVYCRRRSITNRRSFTCLSDCSITSCSPYRLKRGWSQVGVKGPELAQPFSQRAARVASQPHKLRSRALLWTSVKCFAPPRACRPGQRLQHCSQSACSAASGDAASSSQVLAKTPSLVQRASSRCGHTPGNFAGMAMVEVESAFFTLSGSASSLSILSASAVSAATIRAPGSPAHPCTITWTKRALSLFHSAGNAGRCPSTTRVVIWSTVSPVHGSLACPGSACAAVLTYHITIANPKQSAGVASASSSASISGAQKAGVPPCSSAPARPDRPMSAIHGVKWLVTRMLPGLISACTSPREWM